MNIRINFLFVDLWFWFDSIDIFVQLLFNCYLTAFSILTFIYILFNFFIRYLDDFFIIVRIVYTDKIINIYISKVFLIFQYVRRFRSD